MPIYEYECEGCGRRFEAFLRSLQSERPASCPHCGKLEIRRIPSLFGMKLNAASPSTGDCGPTGSTGST